MILIGRNLGKKLTKQEACGKIFLPCVRRFMMTKHEIRERVIKRLREIQELSGREIPEIVDSMVPIGGLPGFDSHNDLEISVDLAIEFDLPDNFRVCVSEDGTKPLSIGEIVEKIIKQMENKNVNDK